MLARRHPDGRLDEAEQALRVPAEDPRLLLCGAPRAVDSRGAITDRSPSTGRVERRVAAKDDVVGAKEVAGAVDRPDGAEGRVGIEAAEILHRRSWPRT